MGTNVEYDEYEKVHCPLQHEAPYEAPRASEKQIGGDHYKDMKIQPTTFIEQNKLGWCEGNAVKYICRHRVKGNIKDIQKAIHYLDLLLEQEYCYVRTENLTA
jgi:hypothetical protein